MATKRKPKRDYAAEYKRRVLRGLRAGFRQAESRGHPGKGEIGIARTKELQLNPGSSIIRQGRSGTPRQPWRPTYAAIRARLNKLGLPLLGGSFRGKKGLIPIAWAGRKGDRYLRDDDTRDEFIEFYTGYGLKATEAYTLWFSP